MWLAVDCGNTRVKWALVRGARIADTGAAREVSALRAAARKCAGGGALVSNVGGARAAAQIQNALKPCGAAEFVPPPPRKFGGLLNHYKPPQSLGVDRWLALLAAARGGQNIIVADAGTALTIDALKQNGEFIGGVIVPGGRAMKAALRRDANLKLGAREVLTTAAKSPAATNTESAAAAGAQMAMAGAIMKFRQCALPGAAIVVTGGDAPALLPWLPKFARHRPHLVTEGIARWRELRK